MSSGIVDSECDLALTIGNHVETVLFNIVDLGNHLILLGMSWLRIHNPSIDWKSEHVSLSSVFCSEHCLPSPVIVQANKEPTEMELFSTSATPETYAEFASVFLGEEASQLPPHQPYNLHIDLEPGSTPKWGPLYNLNPKKGKKLRQTIEKQLRDGLICPSKSPMVSPIRFVKKKSGKFCMWVDYRKLNAMTIKNPTHFHLPMSSLKSLKGRRSLPKWT